MLEREGLRKLLAAVITENEAAESKCRALTRAVPDAVLVFDSSLRVRDANSAASELLGWGAEELIGMDVLELVPPQYRKAHEEHQREYLKNPDMRPMDSDVKLFVLRKCGSMMPIDAVLNPVTISDEKFVIVVIRPLDEPSASSHRRG